MLVADPADRYRGDPHGEGIVAECIFPTIGHSIGIHNVSYTVLEVYNRAGVGLSPP